MQLTEQGPLLNVRRPLAAAAVVAAATAATVAATTLPAQNNDDLTPISGVSAMSPPTSHSQPT